MYILVILCCLKIDRQCPAGNGLSCCLLSMYPFFPCHCYWIPGDWIALGCKPSSSGTQTWSPKFSFRVPASVCLSGRTGRLRTQRGMLVTDSTLSKMIRFTKMGKGQCQQEEGVANPVFTPVKFTEITFQWHWLVYVWELILIKVSCCAFSGIRWLPHPTHTELWVVPVVTHSLT